jgi:RNA polymerase sigma-70 factor (ECF subfamily)
MQQRTTQLERDRELVRRMLRGETRAMQAFCDEYLPKLHRYAIRRLRVAADVHEVVQATLTQAARRIETYRGEATLLTWLIQICRHEIAHHVEAAVRHDVAMPFLNDDVLRAVVESLEAPADDRPDVTLRRQELVALVQVALDHLPTRYADALELRYVLGLSAREMGEKMQIGEEAVQSLLARARRAFREVCTVAVGDLLEARTP